MGWIISSRYDKTQTNLIRDFNSYPELRFLNRFHLLPVIAVGVALALMGGLPWLAWGLLIPTVVLWHGTFTINSLTHVWGKRRYLTTDDSRNNLWLALITCGEGWHNNHHYHQNTANQGWFWWEIDLSYYVLRVFQAFGLVWKLKTPEDQTRFAHLKYTDAQRRQLVLESVFGKGIIPARPEPIGVTPLLSPLAAPARAALIKRS